MGYYWAECSGFDPIVYKGMKSIKDRFLNLTQWVYWIPETNIVCSHAGISKQFLDNVNKYYWQHIDSDENVYHGIIDINNIKPCELFGFTPCKFSDYTGTSATQPCTWIRPSTLLEYGVKDIIHVVGHTPTTKICNLKEYYSSYYKEDASNWTDVWVCDCLENREYLVIENNEFKPCKL